VKGLKAYLITLIALLQTFLFSACTVSMVEPGPKNEVNSYIERVIKADKPLVLDLFCDSGNIEVYTWEKSEIKFEVTKRVRGVLKKEILSEKLKNFNIEINKEDSKIIFKSGYGAKDKNPIDRCIDLIIYLPKGVNTLNFKVDIGNIKFHDDIKGILNADISMANMEINRFVGVVNIKGDVGNVRISNGRIEGESSIIKNIGSISVKAELEEKGKYLFKTGTGNIDLMLPDNSQIAFESMGELEVNEFVDFGYPANAYVETSMGKIAIRKISDGSF